MFWTDDDVKERVGSVVGVAVYSGGIRLKVQNASQPIRIRMADVVVLTNTNGNHDPSTTVL